MKGLMDRREVGRGEGGKQVGRVGERERGGERRMDV